MVSASIHYAHNCTGMYTVGGYGDWSPEGCVLVVVDDKSVCLCNHLTNFALLLVLAFAYYRI